ncbi:ERI1 exoribonuclease 3, partial [Araneus ventricosus]
TFGPVVLFWQVCWGVVCLFQNWFSVICENSDVAGSVEENWSYDMTFEVIEFPVLKVNSASFETESVFHSYVRPVINPELTKFCTQLTGITQEMVDDQDIFEDVFEKFQVWMQEEKLLERNTKIAFVTVGDWDLKYL